VAEVTPPPFVPGRELCGAFYWEAVRPVLDAAFPGLRHSAALLGTGSEVLGFDTERSTDHEWGPRLQLLVDQPSPAIEQALAEQLPRAFRGWPMAWSAPLTDEGGVRVPEEGGPLQHRVEVADPGGLLVGLLGFDPRGPITVDHWLTTPSQILRSVVEGAVYHDGLGVLQQVRASLGWYPHDVGLHVLACQWRRIGQEEHLVGRAAEVGDELGSRLLAGRLARDVVRLCFLIERRHAPYAKWLGSAFRQLDAASELEDPLLAAVSATDYPARERALCDAYEAAGRRCNALGVTQPVDARVRPFHDRPFMVLDAGRFAEACRQAIGDPAIRARGWLGSVDQVADATDVLSSVSAARQLLMPARSQPR
jgi:hypothetical protein